MSRPDDYCPPAYDGCTCLCHRQPGVYHFIACCGTGSIRRALNTSRARAALTEVHQEKSDG